MIGELARRNPLEVSGYALSWRGRKALPPLLPRGIRATGRPMLARPLLRLWEWRNGPGIEWWTGPLDVAHGTNFVVPPARQAAMVVTVHDLTAVRFPELCEPTSLRYPHLVRRALARGAFVHTPSAYVAAEVVDVLGAPPERVRPIPHGALPPPARPPVPVFGFRYVLALGTVEPRKDLPVLVRAFSDVARTEADVRLVIAGEDGWGAEAVAAAIASSPHRDRIVRERGVDDDRRAALLAGAAVFAYPSRYEGFGLPPLEAMAMGCPVVTSSAGALPEVVGDAALLVPPGDTSALAEALLRVLGSSGEAAALVERGRARVEQFSWASCADGLVELYTDAMARG